MTILKEPYVKAGAQFGRWTVIDDAFHAMGKVLCRCECGTEKAVVVQSVVRGLSRSCGCLRVEVAKRESTTHGLAGHPLYDTWYLMVRRCTSPDDRAWADYGGRGITVCARWLGADGLANFIADVGTKPTAKHSLERVDNDKGYEPGNVTWVTQAEQLRNTRPKVRNSQYDAAVAELAMLRQLVRERGGDPDAGCTLAELPAGAA